MSNETPKDKFITASGFQSMKIKVLVKEVSQIKECIDKLPNVATYANAMRSSIDSMTKALEDLNNSFVILGELNNPKNKKTTKPFQDRRSFKSVKNIGNYKKGSF